MVRVTRPHYFYVRPKMRYIIPLLIILTIAVGCSRTEPSVVPKVKEWAIDQLYWYVENEDGSKACLIKKTGVKSIVFGSNSELSMDTFSYNRIVAKGLFTIEYDDMQTVVWSDGSILAKPKNDKWIVVK